jgi:hypothetical protein
MSGLGRRGPPAPERARRGLWRGAESFRFFGKPVRFAGTQNTMSAVVRDR